MDRASPRGGLPAALPLPNHRAPAPRNDRMKYLPVYLFVGFITLILIVLPFIARDESQKIYLPGALEKKLLQKAERIHKKIQAALQTLKTRAAAEHIPPKTLISAQEAIARYGDRPGSQIADNYDDDSAPVLIYHGDLTLNGDLNSAWLQQQAAELHAAAYRNHIIIDGNLTLQGALLDDAALNLSVSGNVQADYLHSADGHLEILGDLDSALGISGAGNQGTLHIAGKIRAPYLLSQEHAMPREADNHDYIHIESGDIGYHPAKFDGSQKIPTTAGSGTTTNTPPKCCARKTTNAANSPRHNSSRWYKTAKTPSSPSRRQKKHRPKKSRKIRPFLYTLTRQWRTRKPPRGENPRSKTPNMRRPGNLRLMLE